MNKYTERFIAKSVKKLYGNKKNEKAKGILVISCQAIGDTITRTPFFRELRRNFPDSYITAVCTRRTYNLIELCPYFDEIIRYEPHEKKRRVISTRYLEELYSSYKLGKSLRDKYQLCFIPTITTHKIYEAWIPYFAKIPRIIGYSEKYFTYTHNRFDGTYDMYLTDVLYSDSTKHEVLVNLDMLKYIGCVVKNDELEYWLDDSDREFATNILSDNKDNINVVINLTAMVREREWPIEKWIDLCKELNVIRKNITFILVGAGALSRKYRDIFAGEIKNVLDLTDKTTLRQTMAVMEKSDFYLGSETGTTQMAAAVGIPGLATFLPENVLEPMAKGTIRFKPWKSNVKVLSPKKPLQGCEIQCNANKSHCIAQIRVEDMLANFQKIL